MIEARDDALAIVQAVREPLVVLDTECRVGLANEAFYALVGETPEQIEGKHMWDTGQGIWASGDAAASSCRTPVGGKQPIVNLEMERTHPGRGRARSS